jgi:hypothetical protein
LQHVEWNARRYGFDPKNKPQTFWCGMGSDDFGGVHHIADISPCGVPGYGPQRETSAAVFPFLRHAEVVNHIECVEKGRANRHGPANAVLPFFQVLENQNTGLGVNAVGGKLQCFRNPTPGTGESAAKGSDLPLGGR